MESQDEAATRFAKFSHLLTLCSFRLQLKSSASAAACLNSSSFLDKSLAATADGGWVGRGKCVGKPLKLLNSGNLAKLNFEELEDLKTTI